MLRSKGRSAKTRYRWTLSQYDRSAEAFSWSCRRGTDAHSTMGCGMGPKRVMGRSGYKNRGRNPQAGSRPMGKGKWIRIAPSPRAEDPSSICLAVGGERTQPYKNYLSKHQRDYGVTPTNEAKPKSRWMKSAGQTLTQANNLQINVELSSLKSHDYCSKYTIACLDMTLLDRRLPKRMYKNVIGWRLRICPKVEPSASSKEWTGRRMASRIGNFGSSWPS